MFQAKNGEEDIPSRKAQVRKSGYKTVAFSRNMAEARYERRMRR